MEPIQMNANTWRIEDGFVRSFLLVGQDKALLIDSGASGPQAPEIAKTLTNLPILLLNTHGDGDHTAGNGAFAEFRIHPADYERCGMAAKYPGKVLPIQDGDTLELGGRTLEIIGIPGHTYGSVAILDVNNRILFSGDSVQSSHIFLFGGHRCPEAFAGSLLKLASISDRYDVICASHGDPELPSGHTRKVLDAWNQVLSGEVIPVRQQMFGNEIDSYTLDGCGFFCDPKNA